MKSKRAVESLPEHCSGGVSSPNGGHRPPLQTPETNIEQPVKAMMKSRKAIDEFRAIRQSLAALHRTLSPTFAPMASASADEEFKNSPYKGRRGFERREHFPTPNARPKSKAGANPRLTKTYASDLHRPRPGEIPLKQFMIEESARIGLAQWSVWSRLKKGKYPHVTERPVSPRCVFVTVRPEHYQTQ